MFECSKRQKGFKVQGASFGGPQLSRFRFPTDPASLRENIVLPTIRFGHLDFDHLILFGISCFGFRISDRKQGFRSGATIPGRRVFERCDRFDTEIAEHCPLK
jgi:hypothetical protein